MRSGIGASIVLVLGCAALLAGVVGLLYGARDGLITLVVLGVPGVAALAVARSAASHRRRVGRLRRQLGLTAAIAVGQLVVVVGAGTALMFVSTHDAILALVIVALAGLVAVCSARLLTQGVLADLEGLGDTLRAVGEGSRAPARVPDAADEVADLIRAANATIGRLDDTERSRRDLIAAVSHDLRTPITSLQVLAEAVEDEVVTGEDRTRYLRQLRTHVAVLSGLIDDLFELSRLEAGDLRRVSESIRLDVLLGTAVEAMQPEAEQRMVRMMARLDGAVTARGNPEELRRVLFNLIQNAIRHTPADGSVTVSAQTVPGGGAVEIEVADTGPGIPATDRSRVFEPFFRGDASRTAEGAGLGLAISRAIVEAHGGRIWLEDAVAGTRVRFSLPLQPSG